MTGLRQRTFLLSTASTTLHPCRIRTIQQAQMCMNPDLHSLRRFRLHTVSLTSHPLLHTIQREQ
jgi:hypothetical protein